ncbi:hypothetical protein [Bradyrhizobium sp. ORS 86]|uniref:hypothetical protein n=1 Tax=unclassified Bradyrhizobium TaxID=2631580 RepID=UPI0038909E91
MSYTHSVAADCASYFKQTIARLKRDDLIIAVALLVFFVVSIVSLMVAGATFRNMQFWPSDNMSPDALVGVGAMMLFIPAFAVARFSFGYIVAFFLLSAVLGYVWLSFYSGFDYPHALARWSMFGALVGAATPLLFVNFEISRPAVTEDASRRIALALAAIAVLVLAADASYGLTFGSPLGADRNSVTRPLVLNYLTGIVISGILPYLFAWFASGRQPIAAFLVLVLTAAYYPIAVNKTVLLLPLWLPIVFLLYARLNPRLATILSLLIPMVIGLTQYELVRLYSPNDPYYLFGVFNLRMISVPALAIDHYANFFHDHALTNFCQISLVRALMGCRYGELGPVMAQVYRAGNFNASFLATEGIASVGLQWTPVAALICGTILSIGSLASRHLSPPFIAASSAAAAEVLVNVPLSTAMVSNGLALLFLLWWLTPPTPLVREQPQNGIVASLGLAGD